MIERSDKDSRPLVLHVVPTPVARGAQVEARALVDRLDGPERMHRLLSLCDSPKGIEVDDVVDVRGEAAGSDQAQERQASGLQPKLVLGLRAALRRLRPSLAVAHGGDPLKYLVAAGSCRRRPLAYYAIGTLPSAACSGGRRAVWRGIVARADVVACEGEEVLDQCRRVLGVAEARLVLAPNGRDPQRFTPRSELGERQRPVLAFVGSLTDGKRPRRFVELIGALRSRGLELEARMIGDGALRDCLAEPAREAGVEMLGVRSDVAELLRDCDIMIFPSRPQGEGMPGVLIEAGLSGLPVVATAVPGVKSVIAHGETGLVVDVDDFDAMLDATEYLLRDPVCRLKMGHSARDRCAELFSLDAVASNWDGFLTPLIRERAS